MKKELLLIAAAATMLTACVNTEDFRDVNIQQDSVNDGSIDFVPFAEKLTKAENSSALYTQSFLAHHSTFDVWGFKTGTNSGQVFGNTLDDNDESTVGTTVTVTGELLSPTYDYSPKRFWDKSASAYYFFAVAPAKIGDNNWATFHQGATPNTTGYFTADEVTLTGKNLRDLAAATTYATGTPGALQNNFNGSGEIDRLIAAPCEVLPNRYNVAAPDKVHLNFIHILSKLNISIKKNTTTLPDATYTVTLTEFGVYNMPGTGNFNENTAAANATGSNDRWNFTGYVTENSNTVYDHSKKIDYLSLYANATKTLVVSGDAKYIVESLVIPQDINYERVALDGAAHDATAHVDATYYTNYAEYTAAKPFETPELSEEVFGTYKAAVDAGTATAAQITAITKTPEKPAVEAYKKVENEAYNAGTGAHSSEPYFKIKYTINNGVNTETFTYYYNLVAAFKQYDNDGHKLTDGSAIPDADKKLAFNEGWQNTLHITINPTAIEFTADVAEWADTYNPSPIYDIK